MSREVLRDRERALEYEFFHAVDQRLLEKLKRRIHAEEEAEALADATGIKDEAVLNELVEHGFSQTSILALSLYPLVRVAWSDGKIAANERAAILRVVEEAGYPPESANFELISVWLAIKPNAKVFEVWQDYVKALFNSISPAAANAVQSNLLRRARGVAESAGGILGIHKISASEEAVLKELSAIFAAATPKGDA